MKSSLVLMVSCLSLIGYSTCQMYEPPDDDLIGQQRYPNNYNNNANGNFNNNFNLNGLMRLLMNGFMRMQRQRQGVNQQRIQNHSNGPSGYPQRKAQNQQQNPLPFGPSSSSYSPNRHTFNPQQPQTFGSNGTPFQQQFNRQRSTSFGRNGASYPTNSYTNTMQQRSNRLFNSFLQRLEMADLDFDEMVQPGMGTNQFTFMAD